MPQGNTRLTLPIWSHTTDNTRSREVREDMKQIPRMDIIRPLRFRDTYPLACSKILEAPHTPDIIQPIIQEVEKIKKI